MCHRSYFCQRKKVNNSEQKKILGECTLKCNNRYYFMVALWGDFILLFFPCIWQILTSCIEYIWNEKKNLHQTFRMSKMTPTFCPFNKIISQTTLDFQCCENQSIVWVNLSVSSPSWLWWAELKENSRISWWCLISPLSRTSCNLIYMLC